MLPRTGSNANTRENRGNDVEMRVESLSGSMKGSKPSFEIDTSLHPQQRRRGDRPSPKDASVVSVTAVSVQAEPQPFSQSRSQPDLAREQPSGSHTSRSHPELQTPTVQTTSPSELPERPPVVGGWDDVQTPKPPNVPPGPMDTFSDEDLDLLNTPPLNFMLMIIGLSPSKARCCRVYDVFLVICMLGLSALLGTMVFHNCLLSQACLAGIAFVSLTVLPGWFGVRRYIRSRYMLKVTAFVAAFNPRGIRELRSSTRLYALVYLLSTLLVVGLWLAVTWSAYKDRLVERKIKVILVLHSVFAVFGIAIKVGCITVFAIVLNLLRLEAATFQARLLARAWETSRAVRIHAEISAHMERSSLLLQYFIAPICLVYPLSLLFQLWGFFDGQEPGEYNSIYYILVFLFVLLLLFFQAASANRQCEQIKETVARLYALNNCSADIGMFLVYLNSSGLQFTVVGAPLTWPAASVVLFLFSALLGIFIYRLVLR